MFVVFDVNDGEDMESDRYVYSVPDNYSEEDIEMLLDTVAHENADMYGHDDEEHDDYIGGHYTILEGYTEEQVEDEFGGYEEV